MEQEKSRVYTFVGADGRMLRWQAKDENGDAYDLSDIRDNGSATISAKLGSDFKIQAQSVTIEAGTSGWVNYTPPASEIDAEGDYLQNIRTVNASDKIDYLATGVIQVDAPIHYTGS